jgi:drug/metabolite transporter (DMT)-like permease
MFFAFLLAILATSMNAASNLLERKANMQRQKRSLVVQPVWYLGIGAALVSFLLQAGALGMGSLAAIEPVLALELVLVVLGSGIFFKAHIGMQEWFSIAMMTAGTVGLILALDPREQEQLQVQPLVWWLATSASVAVVAACVACARLIRHGQYRAALLGLGTGISLGFSSALLKACMLIIKNHGVAAVFTAWQLYGVIVVGLFTFWLLQQALHAGKLVASQPGITLADPFVAIAWGGLVFHEQMNGGWAILFAVVAIGLLSAGAVLLARSPALERG